MAGDNVTIIPITLVSIPPVARASTDTRHTEGEATSVSGPPDAYDLPPSYFEVVEQDNAR